MARFEKKGFLKSSRGFISLHVKVVNFNNNSNECV